MRYFAVGRHQRLTRGQRKNVTIAQVKSDRGVFVAAMIFHDEIGDESP
jgi:hypothetical protein